MPDSDEREFCDPVLTGVILLWPLEMSSCKALFFTMEDIK